MFNRTGIALRWFNRTGIALRWFNRMGIALRWFRVPAWSSPVSVPRNLPPPVDQWLPPPVDQWLPPPVNQRLCRRWRHPARFVLLDDTVRLATSR
ncbi:hypothetical protein SH449x_000824 [Pirellulaceae bacterium SH449]